MKSGEYTPNLTLKLGKVRRLKKTPLKFRKRYLEVSNKACNVACRAELGRCPLIIAINRKILNYILYLLSKDDDSVVKQVFLMSLDLYSSGKLTVASTPILCIAT